MSEWAMIDKLTLAEHRLSGTCPICKAPSNREDMYDRCIGTGKNIAEHIDSQYWVDYPEHCMGSRERKSRHGW